MKAGEHTSDAQVSPESPWLGLRAFGEETRAYFFGRNVELQDLFERVQHRPLTVLFGQSGLGKTSLLRAGLVPLLRAKNWVPVLLRLRYDDEAPSLVRQMFEEALLVLSNFARIEGQDFQTDWPEALRAAWQMPDEAAADALWLLFHDPSHAFLSPGVPRPVFIFDQFEEIFTLGESAPRRDQVAAFRDALACLVENRPSAAVRARLDTDDALAERLDYSAPPARFLLSLREDFLHRLERWRRSVPSLMENRQELRPLSGPQALEAVVEPGRTRCLPTSPASPPPIVSSEVGGAIVRFVAGVGTEVPLVEIDAVPPLLSLLCAELNRRRLNANDLEIHAEALDGRAEDILGDYYERTLAPHPREVRRFVENRLLSDGGFRQPVNEDSALGTLSRSLGGDEAARAAIDALLAERLITVEERGGLRRIELTHDVLTRVALRSRTARREREAKERAQAEAQGAELRIQTATRERRRLRLLVLGMVVLVLASAAGAAFGLMGMKRSQESLLIAITEENRANAQAQLARAAESEAREAAGVAQRRTSELRERERENDNLLAQATDTSIAQAQTLLEQNSWRDALPHLVKAIKFDRAASHRENFVLATALNNGGPRQIVLPKLVLPHARAVAEAGWTEAGDRFWTKEQNGAFQLWDVRSGNPVGPAVTGVVDVARNGLCVLVRASELAVRVLDTITGSQVGEVMKHGTAITSAELDPEGAHVVTTDGSKTCLVWDVASGKVFGIPLLHEAAIERVHFTAAGSQIECASANAIYLWDSRTRRRLGSSPFGLPTASPDGKQFALLTTEGDRRPARAKLEIFEPDFRRPLARLALGSPAYIGDLRFSPDGVLIAVALDSAVRLWDARTLEPVGAQMNHGDGVNSIRFSSDGLRLITTSSDGTCRLWDTAGGALGEPIRHDARVNIGDFSPDGRYVLTGGEDDRAAIWEPSAASCSGMPLRHRMNIHAIAFSPDGTRIATAGDDQTARIWDAYKRTPVTPPLLHTEKVALALFSPDGLRLLTRTKGAARLWNARSGEPIGLPMEHAASERGKESAIFNPRGNLVLTSGAGKGKLWDGMSGEPKGVEFLGVNNVGAWSGFLSARFSPDGVKIVTSSPGSGARVWSVEDGRPLSGWFGSSLNAAEFSPDGTKIVTASGSNEEAVVQLWDATSQEKIGPAMHHGNSVFGATFSRDGRRILTWGYEPIVRQWDAETGLLHGHPMRASKRGGDASYAYGEKYIVYPSSDGTARIWSAETSVALGEPIPHGPETREAKFSPGSRVIATLGSDGVVRLWPDFNGPKSASPEWIESFSQVVSGRRFSSTYALEDVPLLERWKLRQSLERTLQDSTGETDRDWVRLATWALSSGPDRKVGPYADITHRELADREIETGLPDAIRDVLAYDPSHPLLQIASAGLPEHEKRAAFLREYGLKRLPADAKLCLSAARILFSQKAPALALKALEKGRTAGPETDESTQLENECRAAVK